VGGTILHGSPTQVDPHNRQGPPVWICAWRGPLPAATNPQALGGSNLSGDMVYGNGKSGDVQASRPEYFEHGKLSQNSIEQSLLDETHVQMADSIPTSRGHAKELVRIAVRHGFGFIRPALTPEEITHNRNLYKTLHPNNFHSKVSLIIRHSQLKLKTI
jgi:hypothetical protein